MQMMLRKTAAVLFTAFIAAIITSGCAASAEADSSKEAANMSQEEGFEWFYESFNEAEKAAYDAFRISAEKPFDSEPVPIKDKSGKETEIPVSDLSMVYQGFLYDHPEIIWLSSSYNYRVSGSSGGEETADAVSVIPIPESASELDAMAREFDAASGELLSSISGAEEDSEKARILYNCLTAGTKYEEEALYDSTLQNEHTAYGAVCEKKAVCDGIALAYKYLLDRCGVRCILIPGEGDGMPHVWNIVFWDGKWHESDPSWDTVSEGISGRQYFDLTTVEMRKDHERETEGIALLIPAAD